MIFFQFNSTSISYGFKYIDIFRFNIINVIIDHAFFPLLSNLFMISQLNFCAQFSLKLYYLKFYSDSKQHSSLWGILEKRNFIRFSLIVGIYLFFSICFIKNNLSC